MRKLLLLRPLVGRSRCKDSIGFVPIGTYPKGVMFVATSGGKRVLRGVNRPIHRSASNRNSPKLRTVRGLEFYGLQPSTSRLSCSSMAMVLVVLLATSATAAMVLVDHRVTSSSSDEPAVERERRHEGDRQRERQAPPEQQARKPRLHRTGDDEYD